MQRLQKISSRARERLFTAKELELCLQGSEKRQSERLAGRFAAKEAILKALGTGLSQGICWKDIEILQNAQSGAPEVQLFGCALQIAQSKGIKNILVSIAHEGGMAVAVAAMAQSAEMSFGQARNAN